MRLSWKQVFHLFLSISQRISVFKCAVTQYKRRYIRKSPTNGTSYFWAVCACARRSKPVRMPTQTRVSCKHRTRANPSVKIQRPGDSTAAVSVACGKRNRGVRTNRKFVSAD